MLRRLIGLAVVLAISWGGLSYLIWIEGTTPKLGLDLQGGTSVILTAPEGTEEELVEVAVDIMRRRIEDVGGVAEPEIQVTGGNTVLVQLPGVTDERAALNAIGTTGQLSFRPVLAGFDSSPFASTTTTLPTDTPGDGPPFQIEPEGDFADDDVPFQIEPEGDFGTGTTITSVTTTPPFQIEPDDGANEDAAPTPPNPFVITPESIDDRFDTEGDEDTELPDPALDQDEDDTSLPDQDTEGESDDQATDGGEQSDSSDDDNAESPDDSEATDGSSPVNPSLVGSAPPLRVGLAGGSGPFFSGRLVAQVEPTDEQGTDEDDPSVNPAGDGLIIDDTPGLDTDDLVDDNTVDDDGDPLPVDVPPADTIPPLDIPPDTDGSGEEDTGPTDNVIVPSDPPTGESNGTDEDPLVITPSNDTLPTDTIPIDDDPPFVITPEGDPALDSPPPVDDTLAPSTPPTTIPPGLDPTTGLTLEDDPLGEAYLFNRSRGGVLQVGPAALLGTDVADAIPAAPGTLGNFSWSVSLRLDSDGADKFAEVTAAAAAHPAEDPRRAVAIVLDGEVIFAPEVAADVDPNEGITGGEASITIGNYDGAEQQARDLATILRYGSLPVDFEQSQVMKVSATLGTDSLRTGLIAGLAGLVLVGLVLLFYYRALGLVAIFGLTIFGSLLISIFALLGDRIGLTLTLAGVTGIIVAIGITADSYIVYFERIKDELRLGKTLDAAVTGGFKSAYRTIVTADTVSLLGASLLWLLAIGPVRGFALSLGVATVLDLIIARVYTRRAAWIVSRLRLGKSKRFGIAKRWAPVSDPA